MNKAIYKLHKSLEIGSGTKKYIVDYISTDIIILKTTVGAMRYIPTELISILLDNLEEGKITYKNIIDRKIGNTHIVDFLDIKFDKFIFGYERNIRDLCYFCLENDGETFKINNSSEFDAVKIITNQENIVISNRIIKDFAYEIFSFFYGKNWKEIIDNSGRKDSIINGENYFVLDYGPFTRLLGEFSNLKEKESIISGNILRWFPEPIYVEDGKYYYFTKYVDKNNFIIKSSLKN